MVRDLELLAFTLRIIVLLVQSLKGTELAEIVSLDVVPKISQINLIWSFRISFLLLIHLRT